MVFNANHHQPTLRRHNMRSLATALLGASALLANHAMAQTKATFTLTDTSEMDFYTGTKTGETIDPTAVPSGPYSTYSGRITLGNPDGESTTGTFTFTDDESSTTSATSGTETSEESRTSTTTTEPPRNTQPCNGHVEFCTRKYSNITHVGCHNSPFVRPGNTGSNQELPVKAQLNDGVRFVQGQIRWPENGTEPHFCHTNCDLLDAGPINEWLSEVAEWVNRHPFDVVTILLGNGPQSDPEEYEPFIRKSGILKHAYEAPYLPMTLDDWPTLESMILRGKRVIIFMDYKADQEKYPWLHDEFANLWESPFSPTNRDFPCNAQRPPGLSEAKAKDRLYLMNHNLNAEFNVFDATILVPAVALLNETNAAEGYGSVGVAARNCLGDWDRAPNILNVDYYNYGDPPGSVFEVAAEMNNVTYNGDCCGKVDAAGMVQVARWMALVPGLLSAYLLTV